MNPFYRAFVEVVPEGTKIRPTLEREFEAAGRSGGRLAGGGLRTGVLGVVGGLGGAIAGAFAAIGVGKIVSDAITNASDVREAGTAINEVFGPGAAQIKEFAAAGAAAFGQSSIDVLRAAQTFGIYGKAAGLAGDANVGFSQELVALSTDLASFFNTDPSQAVNAIAAGLRGESEPLRQFGVLLDDATLKQRAMELGIYDGTGALTQQQRVLAAQAEILAQTSTAQGDFGRTSDGLANQQRILAAGVENLSASFGELLLPVALAIVGVLNTAVVPALQTALPFVSAFTDALAAAFSGGPMPTDSILPPGLLEVLQQIGSVARDVFSSIWAAVEPLLPQFLELWSTISPVGILFRAIQPLIPQIVSVFSQLASTVGGALGQAFTVLGPVLADLAGIVSGLLSQVLGDVLLPTLLELATIAGPLFADLLTRLAPLLAQIGGLVGKLLGVLVPLLEPIFGLIAPIAQLIATLLPPLLDLFIAILSPILDLVGLLVDALGPVLEVVIGLLAGWIGTIVDVVSFLIALVTGSDDASAMLQAIWARVSAFFAGLWAGIVKFFEDGVANAIDFVTSLPQKILDALSGLGKLLFDSGRDLIQGLIDGAQSLLRNLGKFFLDVLPSWIVEPFKVALGINSPSKVFAGFGENIGEGVLVGVDRVESRVSGRLQSLVDVPNVAANVEQMTAAAVARGGDRPIYTETGTLLGWIREVANGEAQLVWATVDRSEALATRMGR